MKHDPDGKYHQTYSGKAPFSNMLYCGECGMPVHRRRITSKREGKPYKFTVWHCRLAAQKIEADFDCHSKYVWEEVIEAAYNEMLLKMTEEIDLIRAEGEAAIQDISLTDDEKNRLKELEKIIDRINDRISEMAMRESITNDPIYDATLRNLIYESQIYQQEHDALMESQDESNYMKKNLDKLISYLETHEDFETFDANFFKQVVERGILHEDYKIEIIFKCGVKRIAHGWRRGKIQ
jgi:predicted DNA-binding antitoxin AbrB/MazE fold protein